MKVKKILLIVIHVLISLAFTMAGLMKLMTPYEELIVEMNWAREFSPMLVKLIGLLEILGVLGMNLPLLLKKFSKLIPWAALGLALTMLGATGTHIALGEGFMPTLVLMIMAVYLAYAWNKKMASNKD